MNKIIIFICSLLLLLYFYAISKSDSQTKRNKPQISRIIKIYDIENKNKFNTTFRETYYDDI